MARKLYIFSPTSRVRTDGQGSGQVKWLGGFTGNYTYLGDFSARMLGVGPHLSMKRMPMWLHHVPEGGVKIIKGGASRLDRGKSWI